MKLLVEPSSLSSHSYEKADGVILALTGYSVESVCTFSMDEICKIQKNYSGEIFVKVNRNFFNEDIDGLKEVLWLSCFTNKEGIIFIPSSCLESNPYG